MARSKNACAYQRGLPCPHQGLHRHCHLRRRWHHRWKRRSPSLQEPPLQTGARRFLTGLTQSLPPNQSPHLHSSLTGAVQYQPSAMSSRAQHVEVQSAEMHRAKVDGWQQTRADRRRGHERALCPRLCRCQPRPHRCRRSRRQGVYRWPRPSAQRIGQWPPMGRRLAAVRGKTLTLCWRRRKRPPPCWGVLLCPCPGGASYPSVAAVLAGCKRSSVGEVVPWL